MVLTFNETQTLNKLAQDVKQINTSLRHITAQLRVVVNRLTPPAPPPSPPPPPPPLQSDSDSEQ